MISKRTGKKVGRPGLRLREDPDRYCLAFFVALTWIAHDRGLSAQKVAVTLMAMRHGEFVPSPENVSALEQGLPIQIAYPANKVRGRAGKEWRERSTFHWRADLFLRKARKLERRLQASPEGSDFHWFAMLATAWRVAVGGHGDLLNVAAQLCESIGEQAYFERAIAPFIKRRPLA
jgi:hypothetical protein